MPNINDFKSRLRGGGARANQFKVTLPFPGYAAVGGETSDLAFLCRATAIPGQTIPCLLYTSPSPRDLSTSRMPSSA